MSTPPEQYKKKKTRKYLRLMHSLGVSEGKNSNIYLTAFSGATVDKRLRGEPCKPNMY